LQDVILSLIADLCILLKFSSYEALLIKKHALKLNRQLYVGSASFLLQVF